MNSKNSKDKANQMPYEDKIIELGEKLREQHIEDMVFNLEQAYRLRDWDKLEQVLEYINSFNGMIDLNRKRKLQSFFVTLHNKLDHEPQNRHENGDNLTYHIALYAPKHSYKQGLQHNIMLGTFLFEPSLT